MYTKTEHYDKDGNFIGVSVTQENGHTDNYDKDFNWVSSSETEKSE